MGKQLVFPPEFFSNELFINRRIDDTFIKKAIEHIDILSKVYSTIIIFLDSIGGEFLPAIELYEKILSLSSNGIKVVGVAGENISSSTAIIFQACSVRLIRKNITKSMTLHNIKDTTFFEFIPFVTSRQKVHDVMDKNMDSSYQMQNYLNVIFTSSSNLSKEKVEELLGRETNLNADQILEYGLADGFYNPEDYS